MAWESHRPKSGSPLAARKGLMLMAEGGGSQFSGAARPESLHGSMTGSLETRTDMSSLLTDEDYGHSGPPPLAVHVSIRFTDPIIRSRYHRTYNSSPGFEATSRICNGLVRRIDHCSNEFITRKDSGALDMMVKDGSTAQKPMRFEMKFRVSRRSMGQWAERTFKSYQKQPLTVDAAREIVQLSHRTVVMYLKRHDRDFRVMDGGLREAGPERSEPLSPSFDGPLSPLCIPRSEFAGMSQELDFVPGYAIQLAFTSRNQRRRQPMFRQMLEIKSRQTAPMTIPRIEDFLQRGIEAIQRELAMKRHDGVNCQHVDEDALEIDLQVNNNLGPSYDHVHRSTKSKLFMFDDPDSWECQEFLKKVEEALTRERDRLDDEINNLDDFQLQVLDMKGWGWAVQEPPELQFRLDSSATYSRRTIEAALDRIQTGISDILRGHNVAIHFNAHKRGHLVLDKAFVAREKRGKPREMFTSPDEQKAAFVSRLKERIQTDLDMVCKDTCAIDDIKDDDVEPQTKIASVAAVGSVAHDKKDAPALGLGKLSVGETIEILESGKASPRTPTTPTTSSSARSFSLVGFPPRTSSLRKDSAKAHAQFLVSSGPASADKPRTSGLSNSLTSPARPVTVHGGSGTMNGLSSKSTADEDSIRSITVKDGSLVISQPKMEKLEDQKEKEGRSLRKFLAKAARRSFPLSSSNKKKRDPSIRPTTASTLTSTNSDVLPESPLAHKYRDVQDRPVPMFAPVEEKKEEPEGRPQPSPMSSKVVSPMPTSTLPVITLPTEGFLMHCVEGDDDQDEETGFPDQTATEGKVRSIVPSVLAPSEATEAALSPEEFAYITDAGGMDPESSMVSEDTQITQQTMVTQQSTLTASFGDSEPESTAPSTPALSSGNESSPRHSLLITPTHVRTLKEAADKDPERMSGDLNRPKMRALQDGSSREQAEEIRPVPVAPALLVPGLRWDAKDVLGAAGKALGIEDSAASVPGKLDVEEATRSVSVPEPTPEPKVVELAASGLDVVPKLSGLEPSIAMPTSELAPDQATSPSEVTPLEESVQTTTSDVRQVDNSGAETTQITLKKPASVPRIEGWLGYESTAGADNTEESTAPTKGAELHHNGGEALLAAPPDVLDLTSITKKPDLDSASAEPILAVPSTKSDPTEKELGGAATGPATQILERVPEAVGFATNDLAAVVQFADSEPQSANPTLSKDVNDPVQGPNNGSESYTCTQAISPSAHASIPVKETVPFSDPTKQPIGECAGPVVDFVAPSDLGGEVRDQQPANELAHPATASVSIENTEPTVVAEGSKNDAVIVTEAGPDVPEAASGPAIPAADESGPEVPTLEAGAESPQGNSGSTSDRVTIGEASEREPSAPSEALLPEPTTSPRNVEESGPSRVAGSGSGSNPLMETLRTLRNPSLLQPAPAGSARSSLISVASVTSDTSESLYSDTQSTIVGSSRGSVDTMRPSILGDEDIAEARQREQQADEADAHAYRPMTAGYLGLHETRLVDMGLRGALTGNRRFSMPLSQVLGNSRPSSADTASPLPSPGPKQQLLTEMPSASATLSRKKRKDHKVKRKSSRRTKSTSDALNLVAAAPDACAVAAEAEDAHNPERYMGRAIVLLGAVAVATRLWNKNL